MGNPIIKNYRMRRNGGEVERASETSDLAYSNNQIRTMNNMGMADSLLNDGHSNLNYGTPALNTLPGKRDLGTEGMTLEQKLEYYKNQKEKSTNKETSNIKMGMGRSLRTGRNILNKN